MKRKLLTLLLVATALCSLIACTNKTVTKSEEKKSSEKESLETVMLSDDHFELREKEITLEYGEPLNEDLSEYVIAKNYDYITCKYKEIVWTDFVAGDKGKAVFSIDDGKTLEMIINYTDTTPPTAECHEYTFYSLDVSGENRLSDADSPLFIEKMDCVGPDGAHYFSVDNFEDYYKIDDNVRHYYSSVLVNGVEVELNSKEPLATLIPFTYFKYGINNIEICTYDDSGNTSVHNCTLNIIRDISQESFEYMKEKYGYSEEEIRAGVENYKNTHDAKL